MSNQEEIREELQEALVARLKKAVGTFETAKTAEEVHIGAAELMEILWEVKAHFGSEISQDAEQVLGQMQSFWLHDCSRHQICEEVKFIIRSAEQQI